MISPLAESYRGPYLLAPDAPTPARLEAARQQQSAERARRVASERAAAVDEAARIVGRR